MVSSGSDCDYRGRVTSADPLAPLLDLVDVRDALAAARAAVDASLGHRALRRQGGAVAAEVSLRSAVASAALEGHGYDRDDIRAGTVTDPVVQGALRVAGAIGGLTDVWGRAPRQVLATLHVLAARGVLPESQLGRPVLAPSAEADVAAGPDPQPGRSPVGPRLDALAALVAGDSKVPPILLAAVVHGELLALRPFAGPLGVVARAAARLTLIGRGLDPRGLIAVEVGHVEREPEYVGAAGAFATGTPDGVRSWLRHYAAAVERGAAEAVAVGDAVLARS